MSLRGRATAAAALVLLGGCSAAHRRQEAAYAGGEAGTYFRDSIRAAATAKPPPSDTPPEFRAERDKVAADLAARADSWRKRDAAGEALAGFQALAGENVSTRRAELSNPETCERVLAEGASLADIKLVAVDRNPGLRAAHGRWRGVLEQYEQAGYLENLLLQYRAFSKTLDTGIGDELQKGMVQVQFPFPATVTLKGELAERDAEMSWEEYRMAIRDLLVEVAAVYYEIEYLDDALRVTRESRELLAHIEGVARARYETGAMEQIGLLRIQSELSRLDFDLTTLEQERATALAQLNKNLSRPPQAPLGAIRPSAAYDPAPDLETIIAVALECRQELRLQRIRILMSEQAIRLAESMVYPRASTGASLAQDEAALEAGPDRGMAIFPTNPRPEPRYRFGQDAAYIDQLRRNLEATRAALVSLEDRVRFEAKDLHFSIDTARRQVKLFEVSLVPQAEEALKSAGSGYQTGKLTYLDFIEAERGLLEARLGEKQARRDLHKAINRLLEVTGCNRAG